MLFSCFLSLIYFFFLLWWFSFITSFSHYYSKCTVSSYIDASYSYLLPLCSFFFQFPCYFHFLLLLLFSILVVFFPLLLIPYYFSFFFSSVYFHCFLFLSIIPFILCQTSMINSYTLLHHLSCTLPTYITISFSHLR